MNTLSLTLPADEACPPLAQKAPRIEISVVIPTFNEIANVLEVIRRLETALEGFVWEVVFVDDNSPDGTARFIRAIAQQDRRVRCVQRIGRRGLSSACVEGMMAAAGDLIAVMDADLQHDETILPAMIEALRGDAVDIVIGSRYAAGGGTGDWDSSRLRASRLATRLSHLVFRADLRDPMSGFFAIRRDAFEAAVGDLSGIGFKIMLDLFASSPRPLRFREISYTFRSRTAGESKLDALVAWEYGLMLLDKLVGHVVPARFISFCLVGGSGVAVHFLVLSLLYVTLGAGFVLAQAAATLVAMTSNFLLNNILTYRDRRLAGWRMLRGWLTFLAVCSIGALANVGMAGYLFGADVSWVLSALAGILVGTVWNYAVTKTYTWKQG